MVTVVVVAVLAGVAFPSFMSSVRKGRRAEAFNALSGIQQAQERWRGSQASYASDLTSAPPTGLGLSATTAGALYDMSIANAGANTYEAIATAASGSSQVHDGNCAKLAVKMNNGSLTYAGTSSAGVLSYAATNPCWSR